MNIPQEELDKLNGVDMAESFSENEEEEPMIPDKEVEEQVSGSADEEPVADKARVPYSRFEIVNERAIRAEERLKILEEQQASKEAVQTENLTPEEFVELYGDSEVAQRAWALQVKLNEKNVSETTTKILDEIEKRQSEKQDEFENNLEYIDDNLAKLEDSIGRDLTEAEESAVLDIQDEFTPKNEKGDYIAPLLSAEKAFEVYNLRQGNATAKKTIARRKVVAVTGSDSDESGASSDSDWGNYKPGDTGLWRDKLNN